MPTIPAAMLKQLYQRGSLRNTEGNTEGNIESGWQFTMRNHLAAAQLVGIGLICDGAAIPAAAISVAPSGAEAATAAGAITAEAPLRFAVGVDTVVRVAGPHLNPGPHTLSIQAHTREIGTVTIPVQDTVAG